MLTESAVRASDKRALFVGVDAYEAAGGVVLRDLFQSDDGGWLQDVGLARSSGRRQAQGGSREDRRRGLEMDRGRASAFPTALTYGLRELSGAPVELTDEEQATAIEAFQAERDQLESEYETPTNCRKRSIGVWARSRRRSRRSTTGRCAYEPAEIARAGAFVSIDADGALVVDRGYVRPEDEAPSNRRPKAADDT